MNHDLRERCTNTIRFLAADAVQKANSGHPGAPMGLADVAYVLWTQFLRHNPADPAWVNRDRLVLSVGHASALLYSMLHLSGYDVTRDDLAAFRQWGSITPGHPEVGLTPGVECTTGPLGSGFGNAVGMALASKMLASRFNNDGFANFDSTVYVLSSDGDMQEGVTSEAASLAGHLGLGNLVVVYDQNEITIEGQIDLSMSEDVARRFDAYGWMVQHCDGHDTENITRCLRKAQSSAKPSLIVARTVIGKGAPTKAGTHGVHGSPLGAAELAAAKDLARWPAEPFHVPADVAKVFADRGAANREEYDRWTEGHAKWRAANPEGAALWDAHWSPAPADLFERLLAALGGKEDATRKLSGAAIQAAAAAMPSLVGGSADLEPSNNTGIKGGGSVTQAGLRQQGAADPSFRGRNIHFGIREHGMGAIANGLALHGGLRPFCATFEVFSDYMRPPIRLAALSHIPTVFVFTHDSVYVGEDGPTHQPVEHHWALRLIPNLNVWRPGDALETAAAWASALGPDSLKSPSALLLTRQELKAIRRGEGFDPRDALRGGYVALEAEGGAPDLVLISTGSEAGPAQAARDRLQAAGRRVRHVSMPCLEAFRRQDAAYRDKVLPPGVRTVAVEAGSTDPWYRFADFAVGRDDYGASAPGDELGQRFGLDAEGVFRAIAAWLAA